MQRVCAPLFAVPVAGLPRCDAAAPALQLLLFPSDRQGHPCRLAFKLPYRSASGVKIARSFAPLFFVTFIASFFTTLHPFRSIPINYYAFTPDGNVLICLLFQFGKSVLPVGRCGFVARLMNNIRRCAAGATRVIQARSARPCASLRPSWLHFVVGGQVLWFGVNRWASGFDVEREGVSERV